MKTSSALKGLVHAQEFGPAGHGPGDPDALLHAAGKLFGIRILMSARADRFDRSGQRGLRPLSPGEIEAGEGHFDVLPHGQPGKEPEVLKDEGDAGMQAHSGLPWANTCPRVGGISPTMNADERALAAAARAQNGQDLVRQQRPGHVVQNNPFGAGPKCDTHIPNGRDRVVSVRVVSSTGHVVGSCATVTRFSMLSGCSVFGQSVEAVSKTGG